MFLYLYYFSILIFIIMMKYYFLYNILICNNIKISFYWFEYILKIVYYNREYVKLFYNFIINMLNILVIFY